MATALLVWPAGIVTRMLLEWVEVTALSDPVALGGRDGGVVVSDDPGEPDTGPAAPHPESASARTVIIIPNPLIVNGLLGYCLGSSYQIIRQPS